MEREPTTLLEALEVFSEYPWEIKNGSLFPSVESRRILSFLSSPTVAKCLEIACEVFNGFKKDFGKSRADIFYSDPPLLYLADLSVAYESNFHDFLSDVNNAIHNNTCRQEKSCIELMTAHDIKGREFDTVMILDVNDGIWPNYQSEQAGRIEEERRLFYVTVTRTKNNLLFFISERIQGVDNLQPSRFLNEMQLPDNIRISSSKHKKVSYELFNQLRL